jgi:hypothetical protein
MSKNQEKIAFNSQKQPMISPSMTINILILRHEMRSRYVFFSVNYSFRTDITNKLIHKIN